VRTLDLQQGSPPWIAARHNYRCASEAPIVMGFSTHMARAELKRIKATGGEKEFSDYVLRRVLAKGIDAQQGGIAIAEGILNETFYPVTGVDDTDTYLASFDGLDMGESMPVEHKLWSKELAAMVQARSLTPEYYWQLEHQLLVAGLDRMFFICSDGTPEHCDSMEYQAQPGRREQLIAGWDLFEQEVNDYRHVEVLPAPAAANPVSLPALSIRVDGALTLISNLDVFGAELRTFLQNVPKKPSSDQDFVECEAAIKTLEAAEAALKAAEDSALAQTASIDQMRRAVASYFELSRTNRLMIEKLVKARKESIRAEIVQAGRDAFAAHIAKLNGRLGRPFMPAVLTDFPGAVKGLRTVQTLRDAVDGELARATLIANEVADQIQINIRELEKIAGTPNDNRHLFPDAAQLVLKPTADMIAHARQRIADAEAKERKRIEDAEARGRAEGAAAEARKAAAAAPAPAPAAAPIDVSLKGFGAQTISTPATPAPTAFKEPTELKLIDMQQISERVVLVFNRPPMPGELQDIKSQLNWIIA